MSEATDAPRGAPGKTRRPRGGKGSALLVRVDGDIRAALDAEAEKTGQSLSQIAERRLMESIQGEATYEDRLGGDPVVIRAVEQLVAISRQIDAAIADKRIAYFTLRETWLKVIPRVLGAAPISPEAMASMPAQDKYAAVGAALQQIARRLRGATADDPVLVAACQPIASGVEGTILHVLSDRRGLYPKHGYAAYIAAALTKLSEAGETARAEIEAAQVALQPILAWEKADSVAKDQASEVADRLMAIIVGVPA